MPTTPKNGVGEARVDFRSLVCIPVSRGAFLGRANSSIYRLLVLKHHDLEDRTGVFRQT